MYYWGSMRRLKPPSRMGIKLIIGSIEAFTATRQTTTLMRTMRVFAAGGSIGAITVPGRQSITNSTMNTRIRGTMIGLATGCVGGISVIV